MVLTNLAGLLFELPKGAKSLHKRQHAMMMANRFANTLAPGAEHIRVYLCKSLQASLNKRLPNKRFSLLLGSLSYFADNLSVRGVLHLDDEVPYFGVKLFIFMIAIHQKVAEVARQTLLHGHVLIDLHDSLDVFQEVASPLPLGAFFKAFRVLPHPLCQSISRALLGVENPMHLPPSASSFVKALGQPALSCLVEDDALVSSQNAWILL